MVESGWWFDFNEQDWMFYVRNDERHNDIDWTMKKPRYVVLWVDFERATDATKEVVQESNVTCVVLARLSGFLELLVGDQERIDHPLGQSIRHGVLCVCRAVERSKCADNVVGN